MVVQYLTYVDRFLSFKSNSGADEIKLIKLASYNMNIFDNFFENLSKSTLKKLIDKDSIIKMIIFSEIMQEKLFIEIQKLFSILWNFDYMTKATPF